MMNRPRTHKVLADLWGNRTRSLLVVASITVGLFAIGVIATIYSVIAQDMRTAYLGVDAANIYIQSSLFNEEMLNTLREVKGVQRVMGVRAIDLRVITRGGKWESIELKSYPDPNQMVLNRLHLVIGTWPPADGEIVVEQYKVKDLGVNLGGIVQIERPSQKNRELKIVGVVQDLTVGAFSGGGGFFDAPLQGYITNETLDLLDQPEPDKLSGVYLQVDPLIGNNDVAIREVAARAVNVLENNGVMVISNTSRLSADHPNSYLVNAIIGVLLVLGLLVVFLSGFLITNTLQALLNQQIQQIGIMKTIGARRIQIAGVYIVLIFGFGLIAFAVAMPLSYSVSFLLLRILAGQLNFVLQGERVIWPVTFIQIGLALLMPQLAAWLPIWTGTRISVQEALSGIGKADQGKKPHVRNEFDEHGRRRAGRPHLLSRPMLISLRNTFRRKGRLALTLTTLTLGGAIFISTFNVQISLNKYVDQMGQYFLSDVNVSLDRPYRTVEIEGLLADVPGISRVEGWASARAELILEDGTAGDQVRLLAPPVGSSLIKPVLIEGRWIQPGDENAIVLNELFPARFTSLKLGEPIKLRVNGNDSEWIVVGFFQFAGKNGGFSAYTSYDYLGKLTNTPFKASLYQVVAERPGLSAKEQDLLSKNVAAVLGAEGIQVANLTTSSYLNRVAGGGFAVLTAVLLFLAILTALVGSIGLAGTMSMNVMERTREIGVMRAIGASDRILMRMVLSEGLLIGAISYLMGALLSFPISKLMADGISFAIFDAPSNFGFTLSGFVIWLAVVVILSFLASVVPARSAARLTIREVLSYE
jgi:putative ABC transport system permease protein